jgi:nucleoside diphosphate kinase
MMLGNEKMVLTLAVEAEKTNDHALSSQDVKVLDISVSDNWNSTKIKKVLTGIEEKTGGKPVYVVSDNDTKLKKSIREMGYRHIPDVGHTLALAVENTYKNEDDFKAFTAALGAVKIKEVMRPASYLLPPRQRSVARFMNLSASIKWGIRVLENFSKLTGEEQIVFDFVRTYQALIYELNDVFTLINAILKRIKNNGLSIKEKKKCIKMFPKVQGKSVRVQKVLGLIMDYLNDTCAKIKAKKSVWHASSDIIESIFGTYKALKSKNPLHGITNYVLLLPLLTQVNEKNNLINFDSKQALEQVLLKDIKAWKNAHLTENLAVKRQLKLAG